jgi:hypothetical protein
MSGHAIIVGLKKMVDDDVQLEKAVWAGCLEFFMKYFSRKIKKSKKYRFKFVSEWYNCRFAECTGRQGLS